MRLRDLIPPNGIPRSGLPEACEKEWLEPDGPEAFRRNQGHPLYGERDILYRLNRHGYRSPEFDATADLRMLTVGCSFVFGLGVPEAHTFHGLFAERLRQRTGKSVVDWNLGISGASNDAIARLVHLALPVLRPDLVLVLFTLASRREYVAAHDRRMNYAPEWSDTDPVASEIAGHLGALRSDPDDGLNLFRNYKAVEASLAGHEWLYSFVVPGEAAPLAGHLQAERRAAPYTWLDAGRDHAHPGPRTHASLCEGFWATFEKRGGLARLA